MPLPDFERIIEFTVMGCEIPAGAAMDSKNAFCVVSLLPIRCTELDRDIRFVYHSSALLTVAVVVL
jgi:hypothetical protein